MQRLGLKNHGDLKGFDPALCVIKLGSNVVTRANGQLDRAVLDHVADFVVERLERGRPSLIVSSGAVASGLGEMGLQHRPRKLPEKQAMAAIGQARLVASWGASFARHGRHVAQILLTARDLDNRRRYLNIRYTLEKLMELGVTPIINENDTVTVDELRFGDNDGLALLLAIKMLADFLVLLTSVGGVYPKQPQAADGNVEPISVIEKITPEIEALVFDKTSASGSGGMASKLKVAGQAARSGVPTVIVSGKQPGVLHELFEGRPHGTLFPARQLSRYSRKKRFIAFSRLTPRGKIIVDAGAERALVTGKKSLLPAGVTQVEGNFDRQDMVEIVNPSGQAIARGLVNFSATEARAIQGRQSREIEAVLGHRDYDELIHRDDLVMLEEPQK